MELRKKTAKGLVSGLWRILIKSKSATVQYICPIRIIGENFASLKKFGKSSLYADFGRFVETFGNNEKDL